MTNVSHQQLNDKLEKHTEKCDKKINRQVEYRHELANNVSRRFTEVENHIDELKNDVNKNNTAMLDKFNKMYVSITHISDVMKHLADSYKKLWEEFTVHMKDETEDRKELINKLDDAKSSRVSKSFFSYAIAVLVVVLWTWAWLITYTLTSVVNLEKNDVRTEQRLWFIEEFIKASTKIK